MNKNELKKMTSKRLVSLYKKNEAEGDKISAELDRRKRETNSAFAKTLVGKWCKLTSRENNYILVTAVPEDHISARGMTLHGTELFWRSSNDDASVHLEVSTDEPVYVYYKDIRVMTDEELIAFREKCKAFGSQLINFAE